MSSFYKRFKFDTAQCLPAGARFESAFWHKDGYLQINFAMKVGKTPGARQEWKEQPNAPSAKPDPTTKDPYEQYREATLKETSIPLADATTQESKANGYAEIKNVPIAELPTEVQSAIKSDVPTSTQTKIAPKRSRRVRQASET